MCVDVKGSRERETAGWKEEKITFNKKLSIALIIHSLALAEMHESCLIEKTLFLS